MRQWKPFVLDIYRRCALDHVIMSTLICPRNLNSCKRGAVGCWVVGHWLLLFFVLLQDELHISRLVCVFSTRCHHTNRRDNSWIMTSLWLESFFNIAACCLLTTRCDFILRLRTQLPNTTPYRVAQKPKTVYRTNTEEYKYRAPRYRTSQLWSRIAYTVTKKTPG